MAEKIVIQLEVDAKSGNATVAGLENSVNKASTATKEAGDNVLDLGTQLDKLSGGAVSTFKNFVSGAKSGIKSMGGLKAAISATGIGLLVTAAAALIEYFTNFEKPLRIVDSVMNAIGGAINAIVDSFDKLLEGDFVGFFTDVGDAAMDAVDATNALYDAEERLFNIQKRTIVQNAELRAELEAGQKIAADTTLSLQERLEGQEAVNRSSEQLIRNERELAAVELERLQAELAIENNYKARRELEIQIEQTTANLINIEAELGRQRQDAARAEREIIAQDRALKDAALKEEQERVMEYARIRKESLASIDAALRTSREQEIFETREKYNELIRLARKYGQDTVELERLRREELNALDGDTIDPITTRINELNAELEAERAQAMQSLQIRVNADDKALAAEQKNSEARRQLAKAEANAKLSAFQAVANSVAGLVGEQTAAGKAAALASAIISTYQGINAALAQTTDVTPTQTIRFANAAAVAITGFANVKKILSTKVPGGGGGSGGRGGAGGGSSAPRPPSIGNSIGLINPTGQGEEMGKSLSQGLSSRPMKAYVVSEDVMNGIDLENKIRSSGQFE